MGNRLVALGLVLISSCAPLGSRPADSPGRPVAPAAVALPDRWRVSLDTRAVGTVETVMWFDWTPDPYVTARSREGALPVVVGRWRSLLARLFGADLGQGALLHIREGRLTERNDTLFLEGRVVSPAIRLRLHAHIADQRLEGTLTNAAGEPAGRIVGFPFETDLPLRDYTSLVSRIRTAAEEYLYDPAVLKESKWSSFWEKIDSRLRRAQDDIEALFAVHDAARGLGISHFALLRAGDWREGGATPRRQPPVELRYPVETVAYLRFRHFDRATEEVDSVFARIVHDGVETLIIDLRGVPGGDLSAMAVAAHLFPEPVLAGAFVGRAWWKTHGAPPKPGDRELPVLASLEVDEFFQLLRANGAFAGRVEPRAPVFGGRVFVLVDRRTASAAEPLAHLLASTGRATLVGERTAGAMLSAEEIPLGDGWTLRLPTADFYTPEGERLEGRGVEPTITAPPDQALEIALRVARQESANTATRRMRAPAARHAQLAHVSVAI